MGSSDNKLHIVLHALGLDRDDIVEPYRNHFVAGDGHSDMPEILELVAMGMMEEFPTPKCFDSKDRLFSVTKTGREWAIINRPRRPARTKSQRRYTTFLEIADAYPSLTFRQFLTDEQFAEARKL
jgi:hypothetical protein